MATKKKAPQVPATKTPVSLATATIISGSAAASEIDVPDFLKGDDAFSKSAPDGFTPLIQFGINSENWQPGTWIIAQFIGSRADIGKNKSMMYDFNVTQDGKTFSLASLWGSTILDNKMRLLDPKPDDWVFIQYLGRVETSRGQDPAKDFRLAIVSPETIKKSGYGSNIH